MSYSDSQLTTLITRLRSLRTANKMSQAQVGHAIGISRECISNYERGVRMPDPFTLARLASLFKVSVDYLLDQDDQLPYPTVTTSTADLRERPEIYHIITAEESDGYYIFPGDIAVIDRSRPDHDQLSLVRLQDGEQILARTVVAGRKLAIHTPHHRQPVRILPASEVTIIGRVTAILVNQSASSNPDHQEEWRDRQPSSSSTCPSHSKPR